MDLGRRDFHRLLLGSLGAALTACGGEDRTTEQDRRSLAAQRREEAARAGHGPDGPQRYAGYRGLAELPWYELGADGRLRCVDESVPRAVDVHAHLGMSLLVAPEIDLLERSDRVAYMLDCDAHSPPLAFDLDVYANANFTDAELAALQRGVLAQLTIGSSRAATQTLPNLLAEMDDCRVERACLLPIAFGLPFGDDLAERWLAAIEASGAEARFVRGASVHPRDPDRIARLRALAGRGARIVKLHPGGQRFHPDGPEAMEIYEECGRLGLVVFFHAGRAGIEPEAAQRYNLVRFLEPGLERFPEVQFVLGHAGARDVAEAIPLARRHPNAWLGIHGQGVTQLRELIDRVGEERLLFGTDWPFYALAASHAKVLLVTRGRPEARASILRDNAGRLFARASRQAAGRA